MKNPILQEAVKIITELARPARAFDHLLTLLTNQFDADRCQIIVYNHDTAEFDVRAVSPKMSALDQDFSRTVLEQAINNNQPVCLANAIDMPEYQHQQSIIGKQFLSIIVVPLHIDKDVKGALYLDRRQMGAESFTENDLLTIQSIADGLAPVLLQQEELIRLRQEVDSNHFGQLIGASRSMQEVYDRIRKIAPEKMSVYIQGETGVGKELVARQIHRLSPRAGQPFIALNCGLLQRDLANSELFGHVKGAFTGADSDRKGVLERANSGTLFLDEAADIPHDVQVNLLRVLEDGLITPLGSHRQRQVDLRFIIATHKNLEEEIEAGRFRQDLYYRLAQFPIRIPPLRERPEDVPHIAREFLNQFCADRQTQIVDFSTDAITALQSYPWPGNVRELKNIVHQIVIWHEEGLYIGVDELNAIQDRTRTSSALSGSIVDSVAGQNFQQQIDFYKKQILLTSLQSHNWNKTRAAQELGLSRQAVHELIKKYKISA